MSTSTISLHWFLPTYGDSRSVVGGGHGSGLRSGSRQADLDYLTQIALAAEANHFQSVLTPTGLWCEDAWITTAALIARTSRLKFLVALRPGLVSPTISAQQAATFQRLSGNRLLINVVVGGEDIEQRAYGDHSTKEDRYRSADETLAILEHLFRSTEPLDYPGEFQQVKGARLRELPDVAPPIFFGGSSEIGIEVAARRANVYLTWGERTQDVVEKLDRVRIEAQHYNRELEYGIRLHVIARPTSEQAWQAAQELLDHIDESQVEEIQRGLAKSQSEGQRRQAELHARGASFECGMDARELEISPNLWSGVGLVRGGAGTALVGSYEEVAQRIAEYRQLGLSHFVLSGYPHLEETYHVGEGVIPALQELGFTVAGAPEVTHSAYYTPFVAAH